MPLPENIDGLSRAKLKLLLVKLLEEVADLRRAVAALRDDIGRAARIFLNDVHQHLDALGRPAARREWPHSVPAFEARRVRNLHDDQETRIMSRMATFAYRFNTVRLSVE
jgi:hypothetical protein